METPLLLSRLGLPWALVDVNGNVVQADARFPQSAQLQELFPEIGSWPPAQETAEFHLQQGTLKALPYQEGYLVVWIPAQSQWIPLSVQGKPFLNMVVHELRVPLTTLRGYAEMLATGMMGPLTEKQTSALQRMVDAVKRMDRLLSVLSLLGKLESGNYTAQVKRLELPNYLQTLANRWQERFQAKGLRFAIQSTPGAFDADEWALTYIVEAFLENALWYTPEGGAVSLEGDATSNAVRIIVSDSGIGIPQEEQERLFTLFFRGAEATVRQQPGWGTQLYVAQRLAHRYGWSIDFTSQPGQGSRFWVEIPLK